VRFELAYALAISDFTLARDFVDEHSPQLLSLLEWFDHEPMIFKNMHVIWFGEKNGTLGKTISAKIWLLAVELCCCCLSLEALVAVVLSLKECFFRFLLKVWSHWWTCFGFRMVTLTVSFRFSKLMNFSQILEDEDLKIFKEDFWGKMHDQQDMQCLRNEV